MKKPNLVLVLISFIASILMLSCSKEDQMAQERKKLDQLVQNITSMAKSSVCTAQTELKYISIGNKACGGPGIYLVYSTSIDVAEFMRLIKVYNKLEKDFYKKWQLVSDCSVPAEPKSIKCENGKPVAVY